MVNTGSFSPCGQYIITGCENKSVSIIKISDRKKISSIITDCPVKYVEYSPSGRYFICIYGRDATIYEIESGKIMMNIIHESIINTGIFSPCEK